MTKFKPILFKRIHIAFLLAGWLVLATTGAQAQNAHGTNALADSAMTLQKSGKLSQALALYKRLSIIEPHNLDVRMAMARIMSWLGERDSAIDVYESVLRKDSTSYDAILGLGLTVSWNKNYERALQILTKLAGLYPRDTTASIAVARVALWANNNRLSLRYSNMVLSAYPNQTTALMLKALALKQELKYREAESAAERLVSADPDDKAAASLLEEVRGLYANDITAYYYNESFKSPNRDPNTIAKIQYNTHLSRSIEGFFGVESRHFYDSNDYAGTLGGTCTVSDYVSVNADLLVGPSTRTAQKFEASTKLTYKIYSPFSISAGYAYMEFPSLTVNVFLASLDYYFGSESWLSAKGYLGQSQTGNSESVALRANFQLTSSLALQFGGYSGADFYNQFSETYIRNIKASGIYGTVIYFFARHYGIRLDSGLSKWSTGSNTLENAVTLTYRW